MTIASPRHLTSPDDHAELTLMQRRTECLQLRSDTAVWRNPALREQIQVAYADVRHGIGVELS